ncbi:MAG: phosphate ABC transporter permease subunit PstC [Bacteroidales bacterium]|nr:phosphate ABC transporter permease subunit PstC [Bacteroidales bacterium]MBN2761448.1 phosphate ABC transporter permease subunit PstC [Bacteroidales bacterium]
MKQEDYDTDKKEFKSGTGLSLSIVEKQFRFSDWFAEKLIKSVSFFSIAFVILIFLFVFRESLPLFKGKADPEKTEITGDELSHSGDLRPEAYIPGGEVQSGEELSPEVYSPYEEAPETEVLQPETYGDVIPETYSAEEQTGYFSASDAYYVTDEEVDDPVRTLFSKDWQPVSDNPRYGLLPLFVGTLKVTLLAILFAAPLAIMAALYTAMFAPRRMKEIIKPVIELLAGFPSVVIGFFALMVLASFFQQIFGYASRLNAFVGAIAMGLAAIPIIYTLTEDALTAVPKTYVEASLGLGASIRQTAFSVILPAATPGIFAAVILGLGRVFGETMIALMATGNAALISANPFDSVRTLSATIGAEMAEVVFGDTHYSVLFLIGSLLFIFTFALNAVAEFYFKNKVIRRIQGK